MSQRIEITFTCPYCDAQSQTEIYRTIWGEVPSNRELVFTNKINRLTCPRCACTSFAATSLLYTNTDLRFAVWFEPEYDPRIDAEKVKYKAFMDARGPACSYLHDPPRVRDWEDFKQLIGKYERRELVTESQRLREALGKQPAQEARSGCFGAALMLVAASSVLTALALAFIAFSR